MKTVAVYKVLIGEYEYINEDVFKISENSDEFNYDYYFITDRDIVIPAPWNLIVIKQKFFSPAVDNRYYKMLVPDIFDVYDYTIYLDTNISIIRSINSLMEGVVEKGNPVYAYPHFRNTTIRQEIIDCFIFSKITFSDMRKALSYFKPHLNEYIGFECGVLVRETKNSVLEQFQKTWFDLYYNGIKRDQFYFLMSLKKNHLHCTSLGDHSFRSKFGFFELHPHKENITLMKKVWIRVKMKLFRYKKSDL